MSSLRRATMLLLAGASSCHLVSDAARAAAQASAGGSPKAVLEGATRSLVDALAPGQRAVWEHYTDPALTYVTEDNEVKSRSQLLADMQPLPPGSSGWITVQEFRCTDFGNFAVTSYLMDEHETIEGHELHARYRETDTWRATTAGWRLVAAQVYAIPLDPPAGEAASPLADYEGLYALSPITRQTIHRDGNHLVAQRSGRPAQLLLPESGDVFFTPGHPRTRRIFTRAADGQVSGFADRREGVDLVWTRLARQDAAP